MFTDSSDEIIEYKLLILYILYKVELPMTNTDITQFILESSYMNYFTVQQFLSELVNAGFIDFTTKDGNEYYQISENGNSSLMFFKDRLSDTLKESVNINSVKKKQEIKNDNQIISTYFKKNDSEYILTLKVVEYDVVIFSLSLNVPSEDQAKLICSNWKKNSNKVYGDVFNSLLK